MRNFKIRAYYWNPNGTNDIEIINSNTGEVVECIPEALFGLSLNKNTKLISTRTAFRHIASNPIDSGADTIAILSKYFPINNVIQFKRSA